MAAAEIQRIRCTGSFKAKAAMTTAKKMLDSRSAATKAIDELAPGYETERRQAIAMPGREAWAEMKEWLENAHQEGKLMPHDVTTGSQIAMIVTGGDVDGGATITEQDLFDLERKAFVELCRTNETRARIEHMLNYGSPLRN